MKTMLQKLHILVFEKTRKLQFKMMIYYTSCKINKGTNSKKNISLKIKFINASYLSILRDKKCFDINFTHFKL